MCTNCSGRGVVEHRCCNCIADLDVVIMMSLSPLLMGPLAQPRLPDSRAPANAEAPQELPPPPPDHLDRPAVNAAQPPQQRPTPPLQPEDDLKPTQVEHLLRMRFRTRRFPPFGRQTIWNAICLGFLTSTNAQANRTS